MSKGDLKHDDASAYRVLGIIREDFCTMVKQELESGIVQYYSAQIADAIVDAVAKDVLECAHTREWHNVDVRLGIGRVLCKKLKISV